MQEETVMRGYRLSPQQRQAWLAQQHDAGTAGSVGYVAQCVVRIEGLMREGLLRAAVAGVVERHEILRTRLRRPEGMKTPVQVIDDDPSVLWRAENLSGVNPVEQGRRIEDVLAEESIAPFDDREGAVVRPVLLTLSEREHALIFTLPSVCADSWSLRNLAREVAEAYGARERGEELSEEPLQYADLCEWQNELLEEDDAEEGRRFWREQSLDAPATFTLPLQLKPVETSAGEQAHVERDARSVEVETDAETTRRLSTLAAQLGVSHEAMMQACWESLLWRLSGQQDLLVAKLLDGRHYEELHSALGLFARYVPLATQVSGDLRMRDLCGRVEGRDRAAREWQDYFDSEGEDGAARMPLVGYAYHDWRESESELQDVESGGLRWRVEQARSRVQNFALQLEVVRRGESEVSVTLEYDAACYEEGAARRVAGYYAEVLRGVASGGIEQRVSELELMGAEERAQVLAEMSGEQEEWESARGVVERFEEVVRESGERVALEYEGEVLTYAALNARANQLAHCLRRLGVLPETKVGLLVERSLEMLVGLLGILKAGGAYVPLNADYPKERLGEQLADTQSPVVLTQESLLDRLPQFAGRVICLDRERSLWENEPESDPQPLTLPGNLAYVIYTSGSTGRPKGVAVTHANLANYTAFICRKLKLWEPSAAPGALSFATVSTLAADLGNTSIFPSLVSGGRLHVISYGVATDSERFASYMSEHSIDVLKIVPSHLRALMASQEHAAPLPRKFLILGGEALSYDLVERIRESSGGCRIINHYGPTETTVGTLVNSLDEYPVARGVSATVPVGRPIANAQAYILDEQLKLVPAGLPGELYIGGRGVARGYLNRPEQTAGRFIPNPFSNEAGARLYRTGDLVRRLPDGQIEFLGRVDHQVKIRGFRIELGEIEVLLAQHASVREAAVVAREDEHGHKRLNAYVVAAQKGQLKVAGLQSHLKEKLPDYMIPSAFVVLERMPLNANGKLDRAALPSPEHAAAHAGRAHAAAGSAAEKQLAEIWKQVLGLKEVGIHDNFFELGGDSIISIQIIARAHQAGLRLAPKMLFQHQTIAELAAVATLDAPVEAEQGSVSGVVPLTPIQRWFFEQDIPERHHWNQSLLLEVREALRPELLARAVQALAAHHDALRLRFRQTETGWQQFNAETEQAALFSRVDLSLLSAVEQTRAVEEQCAATQASLNLSEGPLLRVVQFDLGAEQPGRLLIVIHHLTVDGLSWRILLEDLLEAYRQLERGAAIRFPAKTTPFKKWAEQLSAYAQSGKLREAELGYWLDELGTQFEPLPVDIPGGDNTVASTHVVTAELDPQETRALLQEVPVAYRTHINDALLTALAQAFGDWSGARSLLVELEGHGREELFDDADVSRTVGWFTTHFPVALNLEETREPGRGLKFVKEQLRRVPNHGIGYGLLRHMREDDEGIGAQLRRAPQPEVSFNYLGQLDQTLPETSPLALAAESAGAMRSEGARRSYLLEIVGSIAGGQLRLNLTYSRHVHRRQSIEALAGAYVAALRSLIAHCRSAEAGGYTPSDFPLIKLAQEKLDGLLAAAPPVEDIYPLSPVQQGLLFHSLYEPEAGLYFEQKSCILRGKLNVEAFRRACQRVVDRHPILRTAFMWQGLDEPLQVVQRQVDVPWTLADWRGLPADEQAARLRSFFGEDRARHFEPAVAPLMRMSLLRLEDDAYHFVWSHHHLLLDGWTMPLLFKEVFAFYEAFRRGSDLQIPLPPPYRNYIAWLKQQDLSAAESFWRMTLAGINAPTSLASAARVQDGEPVQGDIYSELEMHLPETASQGLRALARQHQLTLSTVLQGVWSLVLSHHTGSPDVIFGAPVSGRPASLGGVEFMVGLFINTLPVRVRVAANTPALAWLKALQEQQVEMRQYEYSPLVQVQQWSDVPRDLPLFESILVFDNYPIDNSLISADALDDAGREETFEVEDFRAFEKTNYALLIQSGMAAQLAFRILYDRRLFEAATITRILRHVELLLTGLVEQPGATPGALLETLNVYDREQQVLAQQKRQESRLKRFAKVAPKAIDLGEVKLVETSQFTTGMGSE